MKVVGQSERHTHVCENGRFAGEGEGKDHAKCWARNGIWGGCENKRKKRLFLDGTEINSGRIAPCRLSAWQVPAEKKGE